MLPNPTGNSQVPQLADQYPIPVRVPTGDLGWPGQNEPHHIQVMVMIAMCLGLRISEIRALQWLSRASKSGPLRRSKSDVTGEICTKWNERESTWRKSWACQSRGTNQSKS